MNYFNGLFTNLRFYVLLSSAIIAGLVYFLIGQNDNLEGGGLLSMIQWYALLAATYLYFTLLASPLSRIFPMFPFRAKYIFIRRALGVSAFMFGSLHAYFTLFSYLGGPLTLLQMPFASQLPLFLGLTAWTILFLMALTAFDFAVVKLSAPKWKLLHRFVYLAASLLIAHALLLGSHFTRLNSLIPIIFFLGLVFLLSLESLRFNRYLMQKFPGIERFYLPQIVVLLLVLYSGSKVFGIL